MLPLIDHLISLIVAGVLILSLSVTQLRVSHAGVDQVAAHSAKTKTVIFGRWVEKDILDIGENFGRNRYRFQAPVLDARGNTTSFEFYRDEPLTATTARRHLTRYQLVAVGQIQRPSDPAPQTTFRLDRYTAQTTVTNGVAAPVPASAWTKRNESISTLSFFRINMLDRMGMVTTNSNVADFLQVEFAVLPEYVLNPENFIREMYWVSTLKVRPFWDPPAES